MAIEREHPFDPRLSDGLEARPVGERNVSVCRRQEGHHRSTVGPGVDPLDFEERLHPSLPVPDRFDAPAPLEKGNRLQNDEAVRDESRVLVPESLEHFARADVIRVGMDEKGIERGGVYVDSRQSP